jgi:hypothetical protein
MKVILAIQGVLVLGVLGGGFSVAEAATLGSVSAAVVAALLIAANW